MNVHQLDHVTVLVRDLAETVRFYTTVLGLRDGHRPPFPFPGAWLYAGDRPVIHLVAGRPFDPKAAGAVDHVGLTATDREAVVAHLTALGEPYDVREVPGLGLRQVFVTDPNGIRIELNFPGEL